MAKLRFAAFIIAIFGIFTCFSIAQASNEFIVDKTVRDHSDAEKIGSLAWCLQNAQRVKVKPVRILLPGPADYHTSKSISMKSDVHLIGQPGARIISAHRGNPHNYYGMLTVSAKKKIKNVVIKGVGFKNTDAIGLYGLAILGGGKNIRFENCKSEGCGLLFALNVKKIMVSKNTAHSPVIEKKKVFDDHNHGIYLGTVVEDAVIKNNQILGRFCHGIAVVSEHVYGKVEQDPGRSMLGKRILVEGNTVRSASSWSGPGGGGIWFSGVQDCRVVNNHVEGYADVGIDFEGSRNCVASANVLINNAKNMALFGNCENITFSNNVVFMDSSRKNMSAAFMNSYSNDYATATDIKNTDIFVVGNTFNNTAGDVQLDWQGGFILGTAKRIYVKNNVFKNCYITGAFCDDLETVEISNNTFYNDLAKQSRPVISLAVSERDKKTKQPAKNYIITGNRFACVNDEKVPSIIKISTCSNIHGKYSSPFCDLNVFVLNNIFMRDASNKPALVFHDNYQLEHYLSMAITCVVRNNISNCKFVFDIPKRQPSKKVKLLVEGNVKIAIPPSVSTKKTK